ncbi:MAG: hypothetical protein ACO3C5_04900 [Ilumatobacteraceae bacterium]
MAITEADRLEMHLQIRKTMGDKVADTMMEHLPPTGWADVARKSDVDYLAALMDARFAAVDIRFAAVDQRFENVESRLNGIIAGLWAMGAISTTAFIGLFTLIATKL